MTAESLAIPSGTEQLATLQARLTAEMAARQAAEAKLEQATATLDTLLRELQEAKDQFQAVLDAVPGGVSWINSDLQYLGINSHLAAVFELTPQDFVGQHIGFLNNSPGFEEFVREFVASADQSAARELEMNINGDCHVYLMMAKKYLLGQSAVFVGIDITERKLAEDKLFHDAFHDTLTGLPNRALFMERLERVLEHAKRRENYLFAVMFLDFDGFKLVNDSLGHITGDQLLAGIARRLEAAIRTIDTVARLGGDEFAILLDDIESLSDATHVAERIQRSLTTPFELAGQEVFVTVSIGIVPNRIEYERPVDLLRDADTAMYRAKVQGRNRYEVFDRTMHEQVKLRLQLETDLYRSLDQQDFFLHFQPIMSLVHDRVSGFEALVRWQRPLCGLTPPLEFIPCAEETGLIVRLDRWILNKSCQQIREWQQESPAYAELTINVNLSSRHFSQPDLVEYIAGVLQETGLAPQHLRLEITESAIMENVASVATVLKELRDLGIQLSVDDFGTGYSSLNYLHRLPLNTLKVDRSFVGQLDDGTENLAIVHAIVTLAHNLNMDVVAEGIETPAQLAQFRALGCEYAQGHLFARAMDPTAARAWLEQQMQ